LFASAEKGQKIFVSGFVLLETAWVLKSKGKSAADIVRAFDALFHTEGVVVSMRSKFLAGLARYKDVGPRVGLADCLILADAGEHDALPLYSFDAALQVAEPGRVVDLPAPATPAPS